MAVVSIANIIVLFGDESKLIGRGGHAFQSGRIEAFQFDGTVGVMKAKVLSSLKDRTYDVEVSIVDVCES